MPVSLYFFFEGKDSVALILYLIIASTDFWDGFLARRWKVSSSLGIVLDQVSDKLVGLGFFTGLTLLGSCPVWFLLILIFTSLLLGFGYLFSGPQTTLKLGKWNTGLQYVWIGWVLLFPDIKGLNQLVFIVLALLQIWVFVQYAYRMHRNHHSTRHPLAES